MRFNFPSFYKQMKGLCLPTPNRPNLPWQEQVIGANCPEFSCLWNSLNSFSLFYFFFLRGGDINQEDLHHQDSGPFPKGEV